MNQNIFVICSYGQTASRWLVNSLNLHPDMHVLSAGEDWDGNKGLPRDKIILKADELFCVKSNKVLGCVHRHSVDNFTLLENVPELKGRVFNLIRHPILRTRSAANAFRKTIDYHSQFSEHTKSRFSYNIRSWESKWGLKWEDTDFRSFVMAVAYLEFYIHELNYESEELSFSKKSHIKCEDLTHDKEYFRRFVSELLNGVGEVDLSYIDLAYAPENTPILNKKLTHNFGDSLTECSDVFEEWGPWKSAIFSEVADELQLKKEFEWTGYKIEY